MQRRKRVNGILKRKDGSARLQLAHAQARMLALPYLGDASKAAWDPGFLW
jgi:hypothetical protein